MTHFALCLDPAGGAAHESLPRVVVAYKLAPSAQVVAVIRDPHHHVRGCVEKIAAHLGVNPAGFTLGPVVMVRGRAVRDALRLATARKIEVPA